MKNAISHDISHLGKRKIIFKMPFLGDMLVPWRVADLLIQTIKQTIQTIPSLISSPVFPVSCTTPKWAFCARVLAGSQKSGKLPPFTSFCGTLLEKKNCGFITWLCVTSKNGQINLQLSPSDSSKNQAVNSNDRFLWRVHPGSRIFQIPPPKTQTSQANIQYQWRTLRRQHKSLEQFDLELQVKPPLENQGLKGGRFQAQNLNRLEWNHPKSTEKSVDWKIFWKMLKDVVQPFLNKSVQAHPNHQVSPAWLFFETLPLAGCTRKQPWDILQKTRSLTLGRDLRLWRFEALFLPYQRDFGASFNWHLAVKTHNEPSQTKYFSLLDWSKYLGSAFMLGYSWPWTYQDVN